METRKPKIIVVVGPTASGKSDLAVLIAKKFNGEIVSADSRQVYRGMDIGTGKVPPDRIYPFARKGKSKKKTKPELYIYKNIPHHLLSVASPKRTFTVARYIRLAEKAIRGILDRGKLPVVVGGTGFYIQALVDGITIPEVPPNLKLRRGLERKTTEELFQLLQERDPERAATIERKNKRRLIRAIEITAVLGRVPKLKRAPKYNALFIGIKIPDEELRQKIHARLLARIKLGMISEVKKLREKENVSWKRLESFGLEYRYAARYLQGVFSCEEMVRQLELAIWHYASRQMTWFKKDMRINWIEKQNEALRLVEIFL